MSLLQTEIFKLFFIAAASLGFWCSLSLLIKSKLKLSAELYLAGFVFAMLIPAGFGYAILSMVETLPDVVTFFATLSRAMIWLYGAFLYCFVRLILDKNLNKNSGKLVYGWHFMPFIFLVCLYFLWPPSQGLLWLVLFGLLQAIAYSVLVIKLLLANMGQLKVLLTGFRYSTYYWLVFIAGGLFALLVFDFILHSMIMLGKPLNITIWYYLVALLSTYVLAISFLCLYQNAYIHEPTEQALVDEDIAQSGAKSEPIDLATTDSNVLHLKPSNQASTRYKELTASMAAELALNLERLMREQALYLQNDLSLTELAKHISLTTHQLSELLNEHLDTSFYQYINKLRINYALDLLKQGQAMAIIDLAYQSGFNNKNTFYRVFKQYTQMTPAAYRQHVSTEAALSQQAS